MNLRELTYTVDRCYRTSEGWRVILVGATKPFPTETELSEGASVVIRNGWAVRL